jgi:hypothetical protein
VFNHQKALVMPSINNLPKFYGRFVDYLSILHPQVVWGVPAKSIDQDVSIEKSDSKLPFFSNDLAEQNGLVRGLMALRMFMFMLSHGIDSLGKWLISKKRTPQGETLPQRNLYLLLA